MYKLIREQGGKIKKESKLIQLYQIILELKV